MSNQLKPIEHLLSFVTSKDGEKVTIHADLAGVEHLIAELDSIRDSLKASECPHSHLFSTEAAGESLTLTKLSKQPSEVNVVHHVKIYGWNEEWAVKHGLR